MSVAFGALLDSEQLAAPVALETAGPGVERSYPVSIRAIEDLTAVPPQVHQADVAKDAEMFRDGRLGQSERQDDVADGPLAGRQVCKDVPAARFGDGVERVRGGRGARHT